ncbi:MAG: FecR domain-containing protein [Gemmatimonadaceae bacterium]
MSLDLLSDDEYDRLARYVSGEASAVERADTERWVATVVERGDVLRAIQAAWVATEQSADWRVDDAWRIVASRLDQMPATVAKVLTIGTKAPWWRVGSPMMRAAGIAIIIAGGALLYPRIRATSGFDAAAPADFPALAATTAAGERRTIELPDGSRVTLGVASSINTRPSFGVNAREVDLTGEAMFIVTHDEARPFRVFVDGSVVEDLGTAFAVRSYSGERSLRVAVTAGSVQVSRGTTSTPPVVLSPRDVATVRDTGAIAVERGVDVSRFTAFASGRLIFVDTPLSQVASDLSRWYGVEVRVTDDALGDRHLTSTFEAETLDEVLRIIGMTLDVRYLRRGQTVEFNGSGAVSHATPQSAEPLSMRREAGA